MADDTAIREAAQHYMSRGWEIIALYGVREDGACRCGRPDCPSTGKHPMGLRWAQMAITDPSDAAQLPPGANIGLLTGLASGVFALDVDPKNGGDARLAELEAEHGALPPTWTQRTGSGGHHYVFTLPEDFTPTNSRGRLPVGLDIRGQGGQIVLAPSVSGVGPYEMLPSSAPGPAASWLLELIRPLPPIEIPAGLESAFVPEGATDRGQAYAWAAVSAELSRLDAATPGARNHTAFEVACRLIELSNAAWSGLSESDAAQWFRGAGASLVDATFTERELWACWSSAARTIREKVAVLPAPPGGLPVGINWGGLGDPPVVPPFSGNGSSPSTAPLELGPGSPSDPFDDALPSMGPIYHPGAETTSDQAGHSSQDHVLTGHLRDFLLPRSQLSRLPRPVPLIQGVLWRDTDAWLIGESGSGKSFVGLDWAAHIAAGKEWNNRRTTQGPVIWVVAEGASGVQQRVDAWESVYGPTTDNLIVLPVAVQAALRSGRTLSLSPAWRQLMEIGAEIRPALILLDTQARMTRGISENDNDEMGQWLDAVSALRRASGGCCNLVVHHTGRGGSHARGASAIDGAQDVEWRVERTGVKADMRGRIVADKVKDGADGTTHAFALKSHRLGWDDTAAEYVTSLTVSYDPFDLPSGADLPAHLADLAEVQREVLEVLREGALDTGATKAEIVRLVLAARKARAERAGRSFAVPKEFERTIGFALTNDGKRYGGGLIQKNLIIQVGQRFADVDRFEASEGMD